MAQEPEHITVGDGKYTLVMDPTNLRALRYGERWRDLVGDGLVMALGQEIQELRETVAKFKRLLNPVYMSLAYQAMGGNEIADDKFIFTFMGGGGSDMTTFGDFRALMGDERKAVAESEAQL